MAWHGQGKETWNAGPTWSGVMVRDAWLIHSITLFSSLSLFKSFQMAMKANHFNTNRHVDICDRYFHPWWKCNLCDILGESATHPPASSYCLLLREEENMICLPKRLLQCISKWAIWLFGAKYPQLWGKTFEMQKQQIGGDTLGKIIQCATLFNSHWERLWDIKSNSMHSNSLQLCSQNVYSVDPYKYV